MQIERSHGRSGGTSSMIRNYLGLPRGISGAELAAAAFDKPSCSGPRCYGHAAGIYSSTGPTHGTPTNDVPARAVVLPRGSYRPLTVPPRGVKASACIRSRDFERPPSPAGRFVVGGGNRRQADVYLARLLSRHELCAAVTGQSRRVPYTRLTWRT